MSSIAYLLVLKGKNKSIIQFIYQTSAIGLRNAEVFLSLPIHQDRNVGENLYQQSSKTQTTH